MWKPVWFSDERPKPSAPLPDFSNVARTYCMTPVAAIAAASAAPRVEEPKKIRAVFSRPVNC